ncbi:unnamed protein product, partial [Polarella glacialis]
QSSASPESGEAEMPSGQLRSADHANNNNSNNNNTNNSNSNNNSSSSKNNNSNNNNISSNNNHAQRLDLGPAAASLESALGGATPQSATRAGKKADESPRAEQQCPSHTGENEVKPDQSLRAVARAAKPGELRLVPQSCSDEQLKVWMSFFGMKPTSSREFMVKRLLEIDTYLNGEQPKSADNALQPELSADLARSAASPQAPRQRGRPKKRARPPEGEESRLEVENRATSPNAALVARSPKSSPRACPDRAAKAAAKAAELEQMVAEVIRSDTELYERLLLFEPVEIGELRDRLAAIRPELRSLGEQKLRKFLDSQGLIFANAWSQQSREGVNGRKKF